MATRTTADDDWRTAASVQRLRCYSGTVGAPRERSPGWDMANQRITLELDDETMRYLSTVGKPIEVLARLAASAADGVRNHHPHRDQTDVSLRAERAETDATDSAEREVDQKQVDALVQAGRERADEDNSDRHRIDSPTAEADSVALEHERSNEDAAVGRVRAERKHLERTCLLPNATPPIAISRASARTSTR